ncbi:hypothetical protein NL676_026383 [Syzygium grande]|nr:hypothetical protein NL676_026383 [Syzygium grande]
MFLLPGRMRTTHLKIWEFDPEASTVEERAEVEAARQHFYDHRHQVKPCSGLIWRMQFLREKQFKQTNLPVKVEDGEEITYDKAYTTLRRAVHFFSALQASDGHWPAENTGPLFFLPPWSCASTSPATLTPSSPPSTAKRSSATSTTTRMKMVGGACTLKVTAPCSARP